MLRAFREWSRELIAALLRIAAACERAEAAASAAPPLPDLAPLIARVDELERVRAIEHAEVAAELKRAEGERRSARAAEERQRLAEVRRQQREAPEGMESGEEGTLNGAVLAQDGAGSTEAGVHPVRESLGSRRQARRAAAVNAKWRR